MKLFRKHIKRGRGVFYEPVDPTDLDKMNLAAVRVLGELKKWLLEIKNECGPDKVGHYNEVTFTNILAQIKILESAVDPEELREKQIAIRAWELVNKIGTDTFRSLARSSAQAHSELAPDETEKGDSHE